MIEQFRNIHTGGGLVSIDDVDLLIQLDELGHRGAKNFLIKEAIHYSKDESEYHFLKLSNPTIPDLNLMLGLTVWNSNWDLKLYEAPNFFAPDKRSVLQKEDSISWLFEGLNDYPQEIYSGAEESKIVYKRKVRDEVFGKTAIVEYVTDSQIINYELLILESGIFNEGGGWVEFFEGRIIQEKDVNLVA